MKIIALFLVLLAVSLAAIIHAEPTTSPAPTSSATVSPSSNSTAQFPLPNPSGQPDHGNNSSLNTSAVDPQGAAGSSKNILPYCVAISDAAPNRTRIFMNRQNCDEEGWSTLFIFTAHAKKDEHHAPYPVCVALSTKKPERSMIFTMTTTCSHEGWNTDFVFYMSGRRIFDSAASPYHESSQVWRAAQKPDRMMMYPYYNGTNKGWDRPDLVLYRSRWRLATTGELLSLQPDLPIHELIHARIPIVSPPDAAAHRCIQNMIFEFREPYIKLNESHFVYGKDSSRFLKASKRDECSDFAPYLYFQVGRLSSANITSVEFSINKRVYAALTLPGNTPIPIYYVRLVLQESLRTGRTIPMSVDKQNPEKLVAVVAGTFATFGGATVFNRPIPNA
ncbi:hypothetical protein BGW39_004242 [Mortierella sp. 14UC]|nr:hypothetical protein BGW39_004242 [Mortierella sp. 14UC]